jgi:UDP-N-acetylmuramoylalanine--D-glutamate ligase
MLIDQAKACVILGENAPYISAFFNQHAYHDYIIAHSMDEAVKKACDLAQPGDTVILNPGFASFDYFSDFVERGEAYKRAVQSY